MTVSTQTQSAPAVKPLPAAAHTAVLQRKCACGGAPGFSGECEECRRKREGTIQRASSGTGAVNAIPPIVNAVLRSSGQPLDGGTRALMEPRFGHHFGDVRVHTDARAAESARAINALAYTAGSDVVFGAGQYDPNTLSGGKLLAHELTHVLQQRGGTASLSPAGGGIVQPGHPSEVQAEAVAERVGMGLAAPAVGTLSGTAVQRQVNTRPAPAPVLTPADKALTDQAAALETEILADAGYKKLAEDSKARVREIIKLAQTKPLGSASGQRNYYLAKLKVAITTPFAGVETGKAEYGCSSEAEKDNQQAVDKALLVEKRWWEGSGFENVEEDIVAGAKNKVPRKGEGGKTFAVDRSDPRNIRVLMKVKLNGKPDEVAKIRKLEDAIERASSTKGYSLDIQFVDSPGPDVFEFSVSFCQWANSGNWASGPVDLSHEAHHALGLGDRYDYIESHADNRQMNVPMRLVWFQEQMKKSASARDPYSKMSTSSNPLLAEDVCAVAFENASDQKKCVDARKDLDRPGIPQP